MCHEAWFVERRLAICQHYVAVPKVTVDNFPGAASSAPGHRHAALPRQQLLCDRLAPLQQSYEFANTDVMIFVTF